MNAKDDKKTRMDIPPWEFWKRWQEETGLPPFPIGNNCPRCGTDLVAERSGGLHLCPDTVERRLAK